MAPPTRTQSGLSMFKIPSLARANSTASVPPPYEETPSNETPPANAAPPSGEPLARETTSSSAGSGSRELLAGHELHSLVLDGEAIYPALEPSRPLYRLTNPPTTADRDLYGLQKVRYRVVPDNDADNSNSDNSHSKVVTRLTHLYDFRDKTIYDLRKDGSSTSTYTSNHADIEGQRRSHAAYPTYGTLTLAPGLSGWGTCVSKGHFQAEAGLSLRRRQLNQLAWRDPRGRLVAIETRPVRRKDGTLDGLPRLDLKAALDEKEMDLLVTFWTVRVWKQSCKELKQSLTWDDVKRISSMKMNTGNSPATGKGSWALASTLSPPTM